MPNTQGSVGKLMKNLDLFWRSNRSWYHYEEVEKDILIPVVNDDAPSEAKQSYENYLKQNQLSKEAL